MLKIGITGGIGSGKTIVCKVFETLGIPVFYADIVAKEIMVTDPLLVKEIVNTFGVESYFKEGILNNKYIAQIVFNSPAELAKLNGLVHPAVFRAFDNWLLTIGSDVPYVLKEAALLFESGSFKLCDENVLVIAPKELKLKRVVERDKVSEEQVLARMDKQLSDEEKSKFTDLVILNDETESIVKQVFQMHQRFLSIGRI